MKSHRSSRLFARSQKVIPGGVNSPVRAFRSVGRDPLFIAKAKGPYVWDADGNKYIDLVGSWGPMILGHAHPPVVRALRSAAQHGTSFGAPTELEADMAELIIDMVPSVEMVRMVNSGTEATMSAVRLARAFTGRSKIIKFEGCYHGHGDAFLIKAGSGAMTFGVPDSPGVPAAVAADTLTAPYNDFRAVKTLLDAHRAEVAAIIVEPVVGNMGCVPPADGFLGELRDLCDDAGALLIFDEVMTGFRLAPGGAQQLYGVMPDLTTLGKIIGGGLPVGAYGGREDIMRMVAPAGPMYQAGTLSGNPLAMAAGFALLSELKRKKAIYAVLEKLGKRLETGFADIQKELKTHLIFNRIGSMFTLFFTDAPVTNFASAARSDRSKFAAYFLAMLDQGIYLPPSQFEAAFLSAAHTSRHIDAVLEAMRSAISGPK